MSFGGDATILVFETFHGHIEMDKGCAVAVLEIVHAVDAPVCFESDRHGVVLRHGCITNVSTCLVVTRKGSSRTGDRDAGDARWGRSR
jgi:hypothetical protein